ncbi:YaaC family protein [Bacillus sp. CGMCC 1.16607]|uniref:YaaC family protein n=1 Tax=Bacillus sp. CGMCC 1.16607 TaxID=3351842 RepID=UPI00362D7CDA
MDHNYKNWTNYSIFLSAEHTQKALKKAYEKANIENADQKSFENCYPFIYYLEHAQTYYNQAANSPILIQPILLFYGFVHLIKACILTSQPSYPENSSVLAHGVSTRKRKKQQYHFFHDEVKIQKHGLFPFIAEKMFHMKHLEGEKASMGDLLKLIPELNHLFSSFDGKSLFIKLIRKDHSLCFSDIILDYFHMTEDRFIDYYQTKTQIPVQFEKSPNSGLSINLNHQNADDPAPLKYNLEENNYYFPIYKNELIHYPEILIHYLLLYNLSMIARYETEWWSELIKTMPNKDYPFISNFLNISLNKGPFLIFQYLKKQLK